MWDQSYRWQRIARFAAGIGTVVAALAGLSFVSTTEAAARAADGIAEISREADPDAASQISCIVPVSLKARLGVLVYREGIDGEAIIVGRITKVEPRGEQGDAITILLTPQASGAMSGGGKVLGARPTLSVERAFRLLISPSIPREEAARAKEFLWPAIKKHIVPGMERRIEEELVTSFDDLDFEDATLLSGAITDLREELEPLEEKLLNRLAERAWRVIGISGVAEGIVRKAADGAGNTYKDVQDWVKGLWGNEETSDEAKRNFLSEEKTIALRLALEEEVENFINDNRTEIERRFNAVINRRKREVMGQFHEKWGPKLYEKAIIPAWLEGEDGVIEAAEEYANDFAHRKLLTRKGGPRLLLAYALRTSLRITDAPLIVIRPEETGGKVEFEWIMPRLAKDVR